MYPASLYQQHGIGSQMVMTGRNHVPGSPITYFWERFGHAKQHLSGYPGRLSTESFYSHVAQLKSGISQIVILDVREHGLPQKEFNCNLWGAPTIYPGLWCCWPGGLGAGFCPTWATTTLKARGARSFGSSR
jgi:hypothetical protein